MKQGALLAGILAVVLMARGADFSRFGTGQGFKVVDYYPASNGVQQLKTKLTGSKFEMSTNNMVLLKDPRIESFQSNGQLQWIASSRDAIVHWVTHAASSTNVVLFHTADSNFVIQARGFLWQQTNDVLILSNQVHTRIDKTAVGSFAIAP